MTFHDVIDDIVKLIGLPLKSIRPGAEIMVLDVDKENENLQLETSRGQIRSRSFYELEKIWNELQKSPAVHVDGVLRGSGTSRNQPETILANLPYVEWVKIHNKKHLAYVKESIHPFGTLREMDKAEAALRSSQMDEPQSAADISLVIVSPDIKHCIDSVQEVCGGVIIAKEQGVYLLETNTCLIAIVTPSQTGLKVGTYPVLEANNPVYRFNGVSIAGEELIPFESRDALFLIRQK